jgi:diguanylate cyclase (GGDEF)-like protein
VLPGTNKAEALIVAERIRTEIEKEQFAGEDETPTRRITASLGVASFPEDGGSYTELVHASDVALYGATGSWRRAPGPSWARPNPAASPARTLRQPPPRP